MLRDFVLPDEHSSERGLADAIPRNRRQKTACSSMRTEVLFESKTQSVSTRPRACPARRLNAVAYLSQMRSQLHKINGDKNTRLWLDYVVTPKQGRAGRAQK